MVFLSLIQQTQLNFNLACHMDHARVEELLVAKNKKIFNIYGFE